VTYLRDKNQTTYWRIDGILFIAKMKGGGGESPAGLTQIRTSAAAESQIERSHMVMMAEFKERNLHVCRYPSSATRTYIIFMHNLELVL
jgi:hypothetical protein